MRRVARVTRRLIVADDTTAAVRDLVQVELAEDHRSGVPQATDDLGILGGHAIGKHRAAASRADAGDVDQILHCDRDAVKRPAIVAALQLGRGHARLLQREIGGDRDERAEHGIRARDPVEATLRHFDRRQPRPELRSELRDRELGRISIRVHDECHRAQPTAGSPDRLCP